MPHGLPLGRHAPSKLRLADVQRDLHQCGRRQRQTENRAVSSQPECVRMPHLCLPRRALLLPSSARGKPSTPCPQAWLPASRPTRSPATRSEEHTSELQSQSNLVCRLLLEKKKTY